MYSDLPGRHSDGQTQTAFQEHKMCKLSFLHVNQCANGTTGAVKITESENVESLTDPALQPSKRCFEPPDGAYCFVVTLLYKTKTSHQAKTSSNTDCSVPYDPDSAVNKSTFSDNGSYISPLCLSLFSDLIHTALGNEKSPILSSTQRFLDKPACPMVVELSFFLGHDNGDRCLSDIRKHDLVHQFERDWNVDIIFQRETVFRRYPRLVCFDMDSTLIKEEVIDLIAASTGVEADVAAITEKAMNGEIDFYASLTSRVKLLQGVEEKIFTELRNVITPTQGVRELIRALKRIGVRTAVFSGGFLPLVSWLAQEFGIDHAHANILSVSNNRLTGELEGHVVDAKRKQDLLYQIAEKEGIAIEQTIAVGDGANDLMMLKAAGLGIAWNAKPIVQEQANAKLNGDSLLDLLYLFGFNTEEINTLIS